MRQIKITVTTGKEGQSRKFADTEYRYRIDVDGDLSEKKVFRFCRECLNAGGIEHKDWLSNTRRLLDDCDIDLYLNGYYKFDKISEEKDSRGFASKSSYLYQVVIPYCD